MRTISPCIVSSVFTDEECSSIVSLGERGGGDEWWAETSAESVRRAWSAALRRDETTEWIYARLRKMFADVNSRYLFDGNHVGLDLLYVRYEAQDHFTWHTDVLGDVPSGERKLSASVLLEKSQDLVGGELEFLHGKVTTSEHPVGGVVVFPAFCAHRVVPVISGVRRVLVGWYCGPAFK